MAIDLNKLREKYEQVQKGSNSDGFGKNFINIQEGDTIVRILPPKGDGSFYSETKLHRIQDGDRVTNFHCRKVFNEKCPLCEAYFSLWKQSKTFDESTGVKDDDKAKNKFSKAARSIKPSVRYYLNAVQRPGAEVKIFSMGVTLFQKILGTMMDSDYGDITDLEKGHDFKVVMYKETTPFGVFPKYDRSQAKPKPSMAGNAQECAAFMEGLHDLQALVVLENYDEMDKVAKSILASVGTPIPITTTSNEEQTPSGEGSYLDKLKS